MKPDPTMISACPQANLDNYDLTAWRSKNVKPQTQLRIHDPSLRSYSLLPNKSHAISHMRKDNNGSPRKANFLNGPTYLPSG